MINLTNPPTDPSQITSESAPTTRADGSALVIGDRWYKASIAQEGFWNGLNWTSARIWVSHSDTSGIGGFLATSIYGNSQLIPQLATDSTAIIVEQFVATLQLNTADLAEYTALNDYAFGLYTADNVLPNYSTLIPNSSFSVFALKNTTSPSATLLTTLKYKKADLNAYINMTSPNPDVVKWINLGAIKTGTPPNIGGAAVSVCYRQVYL